MTTKASDDMNQSANETKDNLMKLFNDAPRNWHGKVKVIASVKHVSRSGMSREISFHVTGKDGGLNCLNGYMAEILDLRHGKHGGLRVHGCGMDMIFHTLNNLDYALTGDVHGQSKVVPSERCGYAFDYTQI